MMMKVDRAKRENAPIVDIWGSGKPRREFLHVDDLADAMVFLMERYSDESHVNVGWGEDLTIGELAHAIAQVVGYKGTFRFDASKPDGTPRKLLDTGKLDALGWRPRIRLNEGLADAYRWYREHVAK